MRWTSATKPDAYLCERTLRNYRRRILELGLDEVLFRTLTDRLIQAVGVETTKQRLDSTAVKSAIRGLTRLGILVEATSKFLRELRRKHPDRYAEVDAEVLRKYVERQGEGCFANTRPSESKRRLPEAARDVYELVEQFRQTAAATLESFRLLEQIFQEQCELTGESPVAGGDSATAEGGLRWHPQSGRPGCPLQQASWHGISRANHGDLCRRRFGTAG